MDKEPNAHGASNQNQTAVRTLAAETRDIGSFKKGESLRKTADAAKPKESAPPAPSSGPLDLLGEMRARQAKRAAATAGGQ